jgi:hypothetical protein
MTVTSTLTLRTSRARDELEFEARESWPEHWVLDLSNMATKVTLGTREPNQQEVRDLVTKNTDAAVGTFSEASCFSDLLVLAVLGSRTCD